ncbi:ribonucleases P/MRP protein subunit POP1 [Ostrinia furnacalis]|uniref:ribonucleases P/MRP protein subunit POP1 n=1 Tax=Ostrinia furnacalis TaxID=93504 RepID=UPI00103D6B6E|nr:ribonucleases P/MRP protein subunit POP1 [Ostrinia furnacalis]
MGSSEFDATLGGDEHLPFSVNSLKFAASRSIEIAAMTESILRPSKTKLIFQSLPVHMRRRVMSHNAKRLPRRHREGHLEQLTKSGLPPKQKRPSRKYRRRPGNLLEEYTRRQRKNVWLETHIWHAKRFHMIKRWSYSIAYAPCDKAFRACYRASSAHCLLQDISYYTPIQITGPVEILKEMFSNITNSSCGLGVCAKAFVDGKREGSIHLYEAKSYPFGYIGKVTFIWHNTESNKCLWLFVHPAQIKQVESLLTDLLCNTQNSMNEVPEKKRKLANNYSENIKMKLFPGTYNRFRLTGPKSHAVLTHSLKCIQNLETIKQNKWVSNTSDSEFSNLKEKEQYWQNISSVASPSELPQRMIIGLVAKDPRLSRPKIRTKAVNNMKERNLQCLLNIPPSISTSHLWNTNIHDVIKKEKLSCAKFIEHVTKTRLVPGEINENDPVLQSVPVVLIQRPGSQNLDSKKIGYGSGWDIIIPPGYGLPFWQTFIMFGARSGGLRESEHLSFEMGECYFPPDSESGKEEEERISTELKEKYFRLPPSKRVNYIKLAIVSPFICPWKILLTDWSEVSVDSFYVLRDKQLLSNLQDCIQQRKELPAIENPSSCLVPIYLKMVNKGNLKRNALICLPEKLDVSNVNSLFEPHHEDSNEVLRKKKRKEHKANIRRLKKKASILKKGKCGQVNTTRPKNKAKSEPSEYVKSIRELWVPSDVKSVRHSCARQIMGYLTHGAFSFSESQSCGVGYIAFNALNALLKTKQNQVLVRNTSSRKYRLANINIIKVP